MLGAVGLTVWDDSRQVLVTQSPVDDDRSFYCVFWFTIKQRDVGSSLRQHRHPECNHTMYDTGVSVARSIGFTGTGLVHRCRLRGKLHRSCGTGNVEKGAKLQTAIQEAETAVSQAQDATQQLTSLPSAYPPHPVSPIFQGYLWKYLLQLSL